MKLIEIVTPFVNAGDTCDAVINYFNQGNEPKGSYINLAKYFMDDNYPIHSKLDEAYKKWLKELIENGRENESIILSVLKKEYTNKEELKLFIFSLNKLSPELNQKWHYFISYWGLREYVTKFPEENKDRITKLRNGDEAIKRNPFTNCPEGKIWYEHYV